MATLTIELPEPIFNRLRELAASRAKSVEAIATGCLVDFTALPETRRAILSFRARMGSSDLGDLGWTDGYEGQTLDQLLALESTERPEILVHALEDAIRQKLEVEPGNWSGVERMVLAICALQREVGNGGFDQFFRNTPRHAIAATDDLQRINSKDGAKIARKALAALKLKDVTPGAIEQAIKVEDAKRDQTLADCDEAFWALTDVYEKLLLFTRKNAAGIRI